jgi:hypothetical protein
VGNHAERFLFEGAVNEEKARILEVATELRQCLGCAYGCCDDASVLLAAMLRKAGLKPRLVKGMFHTDLREMLRGLSEELTDLHWWVECSGYLVDITADQFNGELPEGQEPMPEVVCVPREDASWRYGGGKFARPQDSPLKALERIRGNWKPSAVKKELASLGAGPITARQKKNDREIRVRSGKFESQPPNDNYWEAFDTLDEAISFANGDWKHA